MLQSGEDRAGARIERFLDDHPNGTLQVCVGSASVAGLVWLAERTRDRSVKLLIGDLRSRNFAKANDADRRAASEFLQRNDVEVRNWYRTEKSAGGKRDAHLKVWAVCDKRQNPVHFLVGSANLTTAGLEKNVEAMVVADASEHDYLRGTLNALLKDTWEAKDRLLQHVSGSESRDARPKKRPEPREQSEQPVAPTSGKGCRSGAAAIAAAIVLSLGGFAIAAWLVIRMIWTSAGLRK